MLVIRPTPPAGFCFSLANVIGLFDQLEVFFPGVYAVFNSGPDEPSVEDRDKIWVKTDATTNIMVGIYSWAPTFGAWVKYHWQNGVVPTQERRLFAGNSADVDTYDGGASGGITATTGPFWQIDTDWADKIPVGVGTNYTPQGTDFSPFTAGAAAPVIRAVYVIKPTGRTLDTA